MGRMHEEDDARGEWGVMLGVARVWVCLNWVSKLK